MDSVPNTEEGTLLACLFINSPDNPRCVMLTHPERRKLKLRKLNNLFEVTSNKWQAQVESLCLESSIWVMSSVIMESIKSKRHCRDNSQPSN